MGKKYIKYEVSLKILINSELEIKNFKKKYIENNKNISITIEVEKENSTLLNINSININDESIYENIKNIYESINIKNIIEDFYITYIYIDIMLLYNTYTCTINIDKDTLNFIKLYNNIEIIISCYPSEGEE